MLFIKPSVIERRPATRVIMVRSPTGAPGQHTLLRWNHVSRTWTSFVDLIVLGRNPIVTRIKQTIYILLLSGLWISMDWLSIHYKEGLWLKWKGKNKENKRERALRTWTLENSFHLSLPIEKKKSLNNMTYYHGRVLVCSQSNSLGKFSN